MCWQWLLIAPRASATSLVVCEVPVFHKGVYRQSPLSGIGWCCICSSNRLSVNSADLEQLFDQKSIHQLPLLNVFQSKLLGWWKLYSWITLIRISLILSNGQESAVSQSEWTLHSSQSSCSAMHSVISCHTVQGSWRSLKAQQTRELHHERVRPHPV